MPEITLPKVIQLDPNDDIQDLENSIQTLFDTYVKPIDALRSKAVPVLSAPVIKNDEDQDSSLVSDFKSLQYSTKPLESRCHTFYRILGLPVVGSSSFYNPGFPIQDLTSRQQVNSSINNNMRTLQNFIALREKKAQDNAATFAKQDLNSSLYGLFLRNTPPFKLLTDDLTADTVDLQVFSVNDRVEQANILSVNNPNSSEEVLAAGNTFKTVQHILKPFMVDYRIDNTVTPDNFKICIPFLKDSKACKINNSTTLMRPGLELIIRQRLSDNTPAMDFLKGVSDILDSNVDNLHTADADYFVLTGLIEVLTDQNNISSDTKDLLNSVTDVQVNNISKLLRSIKICIKQLNIACSTVDSVKNQINFMPIFGPDGPISGSLGGSTRAGFKTSSSTIDTQIAELKIKKLNADKQIQDFADLGSFASPFNQNNFSENLTSIESQLSDLTNKKNKLTSDGLNALKTIEQIMGEVSGLGLVDILAVYASLWALDLPTLLSLLDQSSFNRMVQHNPQYKDIVDVETRVLSQQPAVGILDALSELEKKVSEILTFADLYYRNPSIFFVNGLAQQ